MVTYSEEWCNVLGYDFPCSISNHGRVRRQWANKPVSDKLLLIPHYDKNGYIFVCLKKDRKRKYLIVHLAVAEAFIGTCPQGYEVDHVDGNPGNPKVHNLEYVTRIENNRRARIRNGIFVSDETRQMIIELREEGLTYKELALIANISLTTAWRIVQGIDRVVEEGCNASS